MLNKKRGLFDKKREMLSNNRDFFLEIESDAVID